jgi:cobalt-precorrin 5A hydrolase
LTDAGQEGVPRLFSLIDKRGEPGLSAAAEALGLELIFLPREALAAAAPRLLTRSAAAQRRFGLASVAEAAALAGGGPNAKLLGPRLAANGATCAIALAPLSTDHKSSSRPVGRRQIIDRRQTS